MSPPSSQNGKGSQLVPLGSSFGACANACAIVTRAKSSSETWSQPPARASTQARACRPAIAAQSSARPRAEDAAVWGGRRGGVEVRPRP
ncbi:MAG: hypothetical protein KIS78_17380 [Labilithrix sp.]|nr:hypothetical protein [Labilithrix sp.]